MSFQLTDEQFAEKFLEMHSAVVKDLPAINEHLAKLNSKVASHELRHIAEEGQIKTLMDERAEKKEAVKTWRDQIPSFFVMVLCAGFLNWIFGTLSSYFINNYRN